MEELDVDDVAFWIAVTKKTDRKILTQIRISKSAALEALRDRVSKLNKEDESLGRPDRQ